MSGQRTIPGYINPEFRSVVMKEESGEVVIRSVTDVIYAMAGSQGGEPESPIHSDPGALRGDVPPSRTERSEVL